MNKDFKFFLKKIIAILLVLSIVSSCSSFSGDITLSLNYYNNIENQLPKVNPKYIDVVLNGVFEDERGLLQKTPSAEYLKNDLIMLFSGVESFGVEYKPIIVRLELFFKDFIAREDTSIFGNVGEALSITGGGGVLVGLVLLEAAGESGGDGAIIAVFGLGITLIFGLIWFIGSKFHESGSRVVLRLKGFLKLTIYDAQSCDYFSNDLNRYDVDKNCKELFVSKKGIDFDYSQPISEVVIDKFNKKFNETISYIISDIKKDIFVNLEKIKEY